MLSRNFILSDLFHNPNRTWTLEEKKPELGDVIVFQKKGEDPAFFKCHLQNLSQLDHIKRWTYVSPELKACEEFDEKS